MVKFSEFVGVMNECVTLLESVQMMSDHANKLLGFIGIDKEDENDMILSLQPCTVEHFENLQKTSKQISSYADRFGNKLLNLKNVIDAVDDK